MDYAYTLQGWLKGINSTGWTSTHDMGGDALIGGDQQYVSQDANALTLNYFGGDYKPVNSTINPFPNYSTYLNASFRPLFNGNISSTSAYYQRFENFGVPGTPGTLTFYNYKYDQLNRLTRMDAYVGFNASTNSWSSLQGINAMKERVKYDGNGNIKNYVRYSITGSPMDSLTYSNYTGTNRLQRISDPYGSNSSFQDLGPQPGNNYKYDAIGNLTGDSAETISGIKWNVYGKIKEITKTDAGSQYLSRKTRYEYDAQGNRISSALYIDEHWYYSWYVRDAEGNILSTYSARSDDPNNHQNANLIQDERFIYGKSRLGSFTNSDVDWIDNSNNGPQDWTPKTLLGNERQKKQYELTNHLGNVVTTITDYRIGIPLAGNSTITGQYKSDIITAAEYYPFGMISRGTQEDGYYYRFGFNGKENDNEIKGGFGKQQDYGMRIYDPRVAKFLSVDPLMNSFPFYTPYQFAGNSPMRNIDLDGMEEYDAVKNFLPFSVDMSKAPSTFKSASGKIVTSRYTLHGYPGNNLYFWETLLKEHPDFLDAWNKHRVLKEGRSPIFTNPLKANLENLNINTEGLKIGDVMEHHHINQGRTAVPITETEHDKIPVQKSGTSRVSKIGRGIGGLYSILGMVSEVTSLFSGNPDAMINAFGSQNEIGKVYKNTASGLYYTLVSNENEKNGMTASFWIYSSYTKDQELGKYIGVDPIGYGTKYEEKGGYSETIIYNLEGKIMNYETTGNPKKQMQ